jgi:HSP20 family protein
MQIYDDPASPNIFATFELPGVKPGDVTFDVKEGKLFIEGERRPRYPPQDTANPTSEAGRQSAQDGAASGATEKAHDRLCPVHEFRYGEFRRTIPLPPGTEVSFHLPPDSLKLICWLFLHRLRPSKRPFSKGSSPCLGLAHP